MKNTAFLSCGFRPFFLASATYAALLLLLWACFWNGLDFLPQSYGGPVVWHAHELIYGFGVAAIIGFLTTAVPEFTGDPELQGRPLLWLLLVWLAARFAFWMSGSWGIWPSGILNILLLSMLLAYLAPVVLPATGRQQRAFFYSTLLLMLLQVGFSFAPASLGSSLQWMNAAVGVFMILIIVALSRISMRAINGLEEGIDLHDEEIEYLARPPRRNLATFCIALYTGLAFFAPGNAVTGWAAFAAAAAMLNLLNDWHIGRVLFNRWVFSMYLIYWFMALGYALLGYAILFDLSLLSAGRHAMAIGGIGLSILLVQLFAGQVHCGLTLTMKRWMAAAILAVMATAVLRATASMIPVLYIPLLSVSALFWALAFGLYAIKFAAILVSPAADGRQGCLSEHEKGGQSNSR